MRKLKFFLNFEKEETWLCEMATKGYEFVEKSFAYQFRTAEPENVNIKIDYRKFRSKADFIDYITLFEDCGWKHIAGTKSSGTQYFKKVSESADEDIFSDPDSRAFRYKRLSKMYMTFAICYLPIFMVLIFQDYLYASALLNPKELYYTPGLWEKAGMDFWGAFLFETPFALFRAIIVFFFPIMVILYLIFSFKADQHFKNTLK
ncbi:DUF2812 domain-containing protein [Fredinandcohnia onubensis]|uniref:DUF2812 domain-containing protein n=1 Tax=Fredinandcohnia onubensis TaxID=1571209 RepID=UPI000C0BDBE9|nr:DUF2812 domain-containing protein [Fredinandcohnia onubensis]